MKKIISLLVFLFFAILVYNKYSKNNDNTNNIKHYIKQLESNKVLFNRTFSNFFTGRGLVELHLDTNNNFNLVYIYLDNKIVSDSESIKDSVIKIKKLADSLVQIFYHNQIISYESDFNIIKIVTSLKDSTYCELWAKDRHFFDSAGGMGNAPEKYYYVFIYKYNDFDSKMFNEIKKEHTIYQINQNWYYYRSYEYYYSDGFQNLIDQR